jgi:hypothetical protein
MKSYALCPVSDKMINERVPRINGALTVILLITSGLTQSIVPVIFLAIDFFLRATEYSKYSLIGISSRSIIRYFRFHENIINAGPKIFAARIGFIFSTLTVVSFALNAALPAIVLAGVLGLFSFLESAFGICVACEIYPYVYSFLYRQKFQ